MPSNILLIVIDTCRADVFYELLESGVLDSLQGLAREGRVYEDAISNSCWTLPSHASIFTGQRVHKHNTHAGNKSFKSDHSITEELSDSDYRTLGISGNVWISSEFGFDKGFDNLTRDFDLFWSGEDLSKVDKADGLSKKISTFFSLVDSRTLIPTLGNGLYAKVGRNDKGAHNTTRRTARWLQNEANQQQPFFYFINYLEPHLPYKPQESYARQFLPEHISYEKAMEIEQNPWEYITGNREYDSSTFDIFKSLYKAELSYIDDNIRKLVNTLKQEDLYEDTSIIIVGDHGENIGDHELMDHQYSLHQSLINVPLIIKDDQIQPERIGGPIELRDLYPTILDIADLDYKGNSSISQHSLIDSEARDFAVSEYRAPQPSLESLRAKVGNDISGMKKLDRTYRAIQGNGWKLIEASDGAVELYNLDTDGSENDDVSEANPEKVDELIEELDDRSIPIDYRSTGEHNASKATEERLKELGYL